MLSGRTAPTEKLWSEHHLLVFVRTQGAAHRVAAVQKVVSRSDTRATHPRRADCFRQLLYRTSGGWDYRLFQRAPPAEALRYRASTGRRTSPSRKRMSGKLSRHPLTGDHAACRAAVGVVRLGRATLLPGLMPPRAPARSTRRGRSSRSWCSSIAGSPSSSQSVTSMAAIVG